MPSCGSDSDFLLVLYGMAVEEGRAERRGREGERDGERCGAVRLWWWWWSWSEEQQSADKPGQRLTAAAADGSETGRKVCCRYDVRNGWSWSAPGAYWPNGLGAAAGKHQGMPVGGRR